MKWARLENNIVVEFTNVDPAGRYHESLIFVNCAEEVQVGWSYDGTNFTAPIVTIVTIAQAQAQQIALVNQQRDTLEQGGFTYLSKVIQSDPISAQRIQFASFAAAQAIANNQVSSFTLNWTCSDNSILTMTAAQTVGMALALTANAQTLFAHAQTIKTAINTATTVSAVMAIAIW